jgi:hypothetical protein
VGNEKSCAQNGCNFEILHEKRQLTIWLSFGIFLFIIRNRISTKFCGLFELHI